MRKLLSLFLALAMLLSLCACGVNHTPEQTQNQADSKPEKTFTVTVVHADGSQKDFTYTTGEEFVGPVLEKAGLIQGQMGQYGLEISHVDGEKAVYSEDKAYWAVYEEEEYALQGIDMTPVVEGRTYKLVYTIG